MLKRLRNALLMASFLGHPVVAADCGARDFFAIALSTAGSDAVSTALLTAYPDLSLDGDSVLLPDGQRFELGSDDNRAPQDRLADPSMREQFHDIYPLGFDLASRETPWYDPGRPRVEAFFRALYGTSEKDVKARLQKTQITGAAKATFLMTDRQGVACQMAASLNAVRALDTDWGPVFRDVGGSFNWRKIAGTSRYSAHSYGIAFDLNSALGGYWRWSGRTEGDAGPYDNHIPPEIVATFERYGFIWGGKWHHFDGMHFEYRPELILFARQMAD
jgi:D-alanyl-D-alanine carboxypeptidase